MSDLCDRYGIHPTLSYRWQKELFEDGAAAFENRGKRHQAVEAVEGRKIAASAEKRQRKNEVPAERMGEHVQLEQELREP